MAEDTVEPAFNPDEKLLELHAEYERQVTPLDRVFAHATAALARPSASLVIVALTIVWTGYNTLAARVGWRTFDPPPFQELQAFGTVAAVVIATLILAGQRREDEAARRRSQLTLHLAAQSEHKIAKLIALVEEQRRHNPLLPDRVDAEAERMTQPSEPRDVMDRLSEPAGEKGDLSSSE